MQKALEDSVAATLPHMALGCVGIDDKHRRGCPAHYRPAVLELVRAERKRVLKILQWALKEGAKGFYTTEDGTQKFYHCKFCHAVALQTNLLSHEDNCKLFHAKRALAAESASEPGKVVPDGE